MTVVSPNFSPLVPPMAVQGNSGIAGGVPGASPVPATAGTTPQPADAPAPAPASSSSPAPAPAQPSAIDAKIVQYAQHVQALDTLLAAASAQAGATMQQLGPKMSPALAVHLLRLDVLATLLDAKSRVPSSSAPVGQAGGLEQGAAPAPAGPVPAAQPASGEQPAPAAAPALATPPAAEDVPAAAPQAPVADDVPAPQAPAPDAAPAPQAPPAGTAATPAEVLAKADQAARQAIGELVSEGQAIIQAASQQAPSAEAAALLAATREHVRKATFALMAADYAEALARQTAQSPAPQPAPAANAPEGAAPGMPEPPAPASVPSPAPAAAAAQAAGEAPPSATDAPVA